VTIILHTGFEVESGGLFAAIQVVP
jgi:hypothetical protein